MKPSRHASNSSRRLTVLGIALLSLILCLSLILGVALAAFSVRSSVRTEDLQAKRFALSVQLGESYLTDPVTLETQLINTPYVFTLSPQGGAAGYCRVDVKTDGETTTRYICPITEDVQLELYAKSGSVVSFSYGWGTPPEANADNSVSPDQGEAGVSLTRLLFRDALPQVVLDISETPYVVYPYSDLVSLRALAAHYGVTEREILAFNGLDSAAELHDGMELYIPDPATDTPYTPPGVYRVQAGDTLEIIAKTYDVTVRSLCQWNNIYDVTQLGVGMLLKLPVIYQPDPEDDVPMNTTPLDPVTEETEPEETQPAKTEPEETQPAETAPEETQPTETGPEETQPTETAPEDAQPTETEPEETQPTETEPEEAQPTETEAETEDTQPAETDPEETDPAEVIGEDGTAYVLGVPRYFQGDYPDTLYGSGTVKTSGCSVTSLTMVANAVTGYDYTVDELADYFGGVAENNIDRLEKGSDTLGLSWYRSENWDKTWEALQAGKIVIALMDAGSNTDCLFTSDQHFIVLTGLNADGRIMVNDPNEGNYSLWALQDGFANGFEAKDILPGYSGAWVYDRTLETQPERYTAYRAPRYQADTNNGGLTREERYLLACLIWGEARGESIDGQQAVAEVALNRLASGQFGDSLTQVIRGEGQFRSVAAGQLEAAEPTQAQYQAIDRALFGKRILPENIYYFSVYAGRADVYIQVGNHLFSFTES